MRKPRSLVLTAATAAISAPLLLAGCVFPSPSPGRTAALNSVAAVNASNAWAVGSYTAANGQHELMEHWNGNAWQEVPLPPPVGTNLFAITAVNASNLWAVGNARTLHFGGLGWRSIPNPAGTVMYDVASGPDAAVYGLGHASSGDTLLAMTARGWRPIAAVPKPATHRACDGGSEGATDLAVVKANDIWVVGNTFGTGANVGTSCVFTLHWNGTAWQPFAAPALTGQPQLLAVSARAANDVWAVGERVTVVASTGREIDNSVVIHWNGTKWVSVPTVDTLGGGRLNDVDATGTGVWAVGTAPQLGGQTQDMLIKRWTGATMADQPVQRLVVAGSPGLDSGALMGVSVRGGVVTSVGSYRPSINVVATLTERRNAS